MTEEETRQENNQQPPQPDKDTENFKTLKYRVEQFLASGLSFQGRKEKEIMTNEEARQEYTQQQQTRSAQDPEDSPEVLTPENEVIKQFEEIKEALKGPKSDNEQRLQKVWFIPEPDNSPLADHIA